MHFFSSAFFYFVISSFVLNVFACGDDPNPFLIPKDGMYYAAGHSTTINWEPTTDGPVTLILRSGDLADLEEGEVIAESIPNSGTYTWDVPKDIPRGTDYTIQLVADDDTSCTNYTPYFYIQSHVARSTTSSSSMTVETETQSDTSSATTSSATSSEESDTMTETSTETFDSSTIEVAQDEGPTGSPSSSSATLATVATGETTASETGTVAVSANGIASNKIMSRSSVWLSMAMFLIGTSLVL